jgi:hypothetical protein
MVKRQRTSCAISSKGGVLWLLSVLLFSCLSAIQAQSVNTTNSYNITSLPSLITLTGSNTSNSSTTTVTIPSSDDLTYVTINICSLAYLNGTYTPSIWLTNSSAISSLGITAVLDNIGSSRPGVMWQKDRATGMVQDGRYNQLIALNADDVQAVVDGTKTDGLKQQFGRNWSAMIWNLSGWNGYYNWTGSGGEGVWLEVDRVVEGLDVEIGMDTDGTFL